VENKQSDVIQPGSQTTLLDPQAFWKASPKIVPDKSLGIT